MDCRRFSAICQCIKKGENLWIGGKIWEVAIKVFRIVNDFIGKFYHFPGNDSKSYLKQFEKLPAEFVYYEPAKMVERVNILAMAE